MIFFLCLGAVLLVWVLLVGDAHLVTHRKTNRKPRPIDEDEEQDLLFTHPQKWAQDAVEALIRRQR